MRAYDIWFTSDTHFFHTNVIKYSNRPFLDKYEMNDKLVHNWNQRVKPIDHVYHLGDVSFGGIDETTQLLERLNGHKYLILGNHDKMFIKAGKRHEKLKGIFKWIKPYYELKVFDRETHEKQRIVLLHYAMKVWNTSHYGTWHLYGHSHHTLADCLMSLSMDVGVDGHNYMPISYEEVKYVMSQKMFHKKMIKDRTSVLFDHHE